MTITTDIKYVGVSDRKIDLFEGQYKVENGISYNSYVISDERIAVMDSVGEDFGSEWLDNIEAATCGRAPDYLIIQHMEPDHSANLGLFISKYPKASIVTSAKAYTMIRQFFGIDVSERLVTVKEGDTLSLGAHTLRFIAAPMVHWPEVILTYDEKDLVLFSADAFGKFGALDHEEDWACEARRYYFGIVGKYGVQVQAVLKKLSGLKVNAICPLHGPVLSENLEYYIGLYDTWSSYRPENRGVLIAYTSVYGNTRRAAELLHERLTALGCGRVAICDLARDDMAEAVEDAFRYSTLVLASPTYNGDMFPFTKTFIDALIERNYQSRTVAFIENGSWAPMAAKKMRELMDACKGIDFAQNGVKLISAVTDKSKQEIDDLAEELMSKI